MITEHPANDSVTLVQEPRPGIGNAVRRHPFLFLAPVVVALVIGAAVGLKLKPTYSAQAQLNVGKLNVSTQSIPGYAAAIDSLATAYARLVTADPVINGVAAKLHLRPQYVQNHLSATPVPQSPLITVNSSGHTANQAIAIANAASASLAGYLAHVTVGGLGVRTKLAAYDRDLAKLTGLQTAYSQASIAYAHHPNPTTLAAMADAKTKLAQEQVVVSTDRGTYNAALQGLSSATLLQILNHASSATSNRRTRFEAIMFGALVVGVLAGLGLAALRRNWPPPSVEALRLASRR